MKTLNKNVILIFNLILVIMISFSNYNMVSAQSQKQIAAADFNSSLVIGFNKISPANGSTIDVPANSYMILQWTDALLPETDRYQYCIDQTNNNSCDSGTWVDRKSLFS